MPSSHCAFAEPVETSCTSRLPIGPATYPGPARSRRTTGAKPWRRSSVVRPAYRCSAIQTRNTPGVGTRCMRPCRPQSSRSTESPDATETAASALSSNATAPFRSSGWSASCGRSASASSSARPQAYVYLSGSIRAGAPKALGARVGEFLGSVLGDLGPGTGCDSAAGAWPAGSRGDAVSEGRHATYAHGCCWRTTRRPRGHLQPSDAEALQSADGPADHEIVRAGRREAEARGISSAGPPQFLRRGRPLSHQGQSGAS
jgi:hypothetical protein